MCFFLLNFHFSDNQNCHRKEVNTNINRESSVEAEFYFGGVYLGFIKTKYLECQGILVGRVFSQKLTGLGQF